MKSRDLRRHPRDRRAFTLIEVIVAGLITAIVLGSMSLSLGHLGRARNTSKIRFDAYLRADAALARIRRDAISVIRTDDLFFTRLLLYDDTVLTAVGEQPRDDLLLFVTRLRPVRDIDNFNGEGVEYETQYRIEEDEYGPVLWQRRDAVPDEFPAGGGVATPLVEGVVGLEIEAYDGVEWHAEWDSDIQGLPLAVSIAVHASGEHDPDEIYDREPVVLRTVVPIDRVLQPRDHFETEELALRELEAQEAAAQGESLDPEALDPGAIPGGAGGLGGGGRGGGGRGGEGAVSDLPSDFGALGDDGPPRDGRRGGGGGGGRGGGGGGGGGGRGGGQGTGGVRDR